MSTQTIDRTLWTAYREGDRQALGKLAERYYRMLRQYGLKFMIDKSEVEDCIQELFLQLWQNRVRINDTDSVKHYLLKSLRHHILQYIRIQKRKVYEEFDWNTFLGEDIDAETLLIQQESVDSLTKTISAQMAALPARERETLYLRYYQNLSIPEIAEIMDVNRQSVSNSLQKALNKLRSKWLHPVFVLFYVIINNFLA
jgi:RNA polymerase sigma factor (sigma-70 family)